MAFVLQYSNVARSAYGQHHVELYRIINILNTTIH